MSDIDDLLLWSPFVMRAQLARAEKERGELLAALKACVALERRLAKTAIVPTVIEDAETLIARIEGTGPT